MAQPGSAPALGAGGRPFKSARPDFAPVAQGKEQRPSKPRVRGSNPFWRALKPAACSFSQARGEGENGWVVVSSMMVSVAQLAEHRVVASVVEGSSPFTHPNIPG